MTRREDSGVRYLKFSGWIRENLPDSSTGFVVTNQDWIFWNFKTKKLMFVEEKTHRADVADWFKKLIKTVIHPALRTYCPTVGIDYKGYHLIQFENESPEDGKIFFDRKEIERERLIEILSFK